MRTQLARSLQRLTLDEPYWCPGRMISHDLPPGYTIYQQTQLWIRAGVFEAMVHDLRMLLRLTKGHMEDILALLQTIVL